MYNAFESFHESHERIFGNTTKPINRHRLIAGSGTVKKTAKKSYSKKKTLCPHCATNNFVRVDDWNLKCKRCDFEKFQSV
jgi:hypothetical protein